MCGSAAPFFEARHNDFFGKANQRIEYISENEAEKDGLKHRKQSGNVPGDPGEIDSDHDNEDEQGQDKKSIESHGGILIVFREAEHHKQPPDRKNNDLTKKGYRTSIIQEGALEIKRRRKVVWETVHVWKRAKPRGCGREAARDGTMERGIAFEEGM